MGSTGTDGTSAPEDEDGNERQQEQQNDEDRRRQPRWSYDITGEPVIFSEQPLPQPTRPDPGAAPVQAKSEPLPSNWPDILAERLGKLTDAERAEYDRQIYIATARNHTVSPNYQLDLAALLNKPLTTRAAFGSDLSTLNRREDECAYVLGRQALLEAHAHRQRRDEQTRASSTGPAKPEAAQTAPHRQPDSPPRPSAPQQQSRSAASHDAGAQRQHHPSPRKAAPDRTTLARKRLDHLLHEHAERRKELNLPLSRAAQKEFARLNSQQEAERKTLLDQQSSEINVLDYQHVCEQIAVAARWLARDLKQKGSPEAAEYEKESKEALRAAGLAHERRQTLVSNRVDHHGWDRAASNSTYAPPSQTPEGRTNQSTAAAPSFQPTAAPSQTQDPTAFFKDSSGAVLTEDRLRAMLGRYQELRENLSMPSGPNETNEQSRLASAQATVRKDLLSRQENLTQLLAQKHRGERVGTSSQWMAHDTHQLRYRAEARRAFAAAWHAMERFHAIDPRAAEHNRMRAINNDQEYSRQSAAQEAAKGGRTLSAEERANLPTEAARGSRDRSKGSGERFQEAKPGHQIPGRGSNSRGGGRSR
jgi:hypothetical protein